MLVELSCTCIITSPSRSTRNSHFRSSPKPKVSLLDMIKRHVNNNGKHVRRDGSGISFIQILGIIMDVKQPSSGSFNCCCCLWVDIICGTHRWDGRYVLFSVGMEWTDKGNTIVSVHIEYLFSSYECE